MLQTMYNRSDKKSIKNT